MVVAYLDLGRTIPNPYRVRQRKAHGFIENAVRVRKRTLRNQADAALILDDTHGRLVRFVIDDQ